MTSFLTAVVVVSTLWWVAQALMHAQARARVPVIHDLTGPELQRWPTVSAVVPARNEAEHLGAGLRAKLAEGYPALELVVVDDRSTDDTFAVASAFAASDPRVTLAQVRELPQGWLGKVNALQCGLEHAKGEWVLFSDADVELAPGTLTTLIRWAEHAGIDHVAVMPAIRSPGPLVSAALASFFRVFTSAVPLWRVADPNSRVFIGVGAFNLFRRSALDRTPGLEWLKMEIGDDVALGAMLKRAGARQAVVIGQDAVALDFYPSWRVMARALEKNGASAPFPALVAGALALVTVESGYLAAAFVGGGWPTLLAFGAALTAMWAQWSNGRWLHLRALPALYPWFGAWPLAAALIRSAALGLWRGGVVWRGTFYSTPVIREGSRLGLAQPRAKPTDSTN